MSIEEQCRRNLNSKLQNVHEWTKSSDFPGGLLMNKMNALLRAASDTEFGVECSDSLSSLYETICRVGPEMFERCEDMPLLFFARSFAVVLEKAVQQLQQSRKEVTVPSPAPPYPEASRSDETPREDQLVKEGEEERTTSTTPPPTDSHDLQLSDEIRPSLSPLAPPSESRPNCRALLPSSGRSTTGAAAAPAADKKQYGSEGWRRMIQLRYPDKILDFSLDAIKGRVNIFNIESRVHPVELRKLLEPFGPVLEFVYNAAKGKYNASVLTKLESKAKSSEAVSCLDGRMVGGKRLKVRRAEYVSAYWTRPRPDPHPSELQLHMPPLQSLQQQRQHYEQQRSQAAASAAAAAVVSSITVAATPFGYSRRTEVDSDDESGEEWRDDESYDSIHSVD